MKTRLALTVLVLVALGLSGCPNPTTNDAIVGSWTGTALGNNSTTGTTLNFSSNYTWSSTGPGGAASGTWTKSGSTYTSVQTSPSAATTVGTISGNYLTMTSGSTTFIFAKS